jgi:hypothetical protein
MAPSLTVVQCDIVLVNDVAHHKTVMVHAHHSYLAKAILSR